MSYPVSGNAHKLGYHPKGFPGNESFVPHGQSVVLNAPAVFRFIASACPERCLHAAEILGANTKNVKDSEAGEVLANQIIEYMKYLNVPNGLNDIG
jgi:hydroxyacid-oxoacid transhydrogenase